MAKHGPAIEFEALLTCSVEHDPQLHGVCFGEPRVVAHNAIAQHVQRLVRRTDEPAVGGAFRVVIRPVDEQVGGGQQAGHVGVAVVAQLLQCEARVHHHREPEGVCGFSDHRKAGRLARRFAAEQADAFEVVCGVEAVQVGDHVGGMPLFAWHVGEKFRIAAAPATQWAALYPDRHAPPRAFGFGAAHDEGEVQQRGGKHRPSLTFARLADNP
jgi:hypothetical protein